MIGLTRKTSEMGQQFTEVNLKGRGRELPEVHFMHDMAEGGSEEGEGCVAGARGL